MDIFRIYDNLNDLENMETAITAAKELRKQVEATVLFSLNPHVTIDDYLQLAGGLVNLGADVICLNDSFGVMTPHQVEALITSYRRYFHQPLRLHLHNNHQAALTSYQEGVRQGAALVDTTLAALSWSYGPPPVESLMFSLGGSSHDPHIDLDVLGEASEYLEHLKEKYQYREPPPRKMDDRLGPDYLPGPLKEFIREELVRRDARDRQRVACKEAQQVWSDLGYPILKGRILEIVGTQAVENILSARRYEKIIPSMQNLIRGKYGRLKMEGVDGMRFLQEAKKTSPRTEVIVITGFATMETAKESFQKGVFDFIAKPFNLSEIQRVVMRAEAKLRGTA